MRILVVLSLLVNVGLCFAVWHEHQSIAELRDELAAPGDERHAPDAKNIIVKDATGQTRLVLGEREGMFGLFLFDANGTYKAGLRAEEDWVNLIFPGDHITSYGHAGLRVVRDQLIYAKFGVEPDGSTRLKLRDRSGPTGDPWRGAIQLGTVYTGGKDPLDHKLGLLVKSENFVYRTPVPPE